MGVATLPAETSGIVTHYLQKKCTEQWVLQHYMQKHYLQKK